MQQADEEQLRFAQLLPKIELHAHLSGSISRSCLHEIWQKRKDTDMEDPLIAIPPGKTDYDLNTFFPLFSSYIYKLCSSIDSIRYSTLSVLADFEADNVVYLELRTTPREIPHEHISKKEYVETILSCISESEQDPNRRLRSRLILSVDRRNTLEQAYEAINLAVKYQNRGVVGVDLCGDPAKTPIKQLAPAFHRAKAAGLKITLHFAEAPVSSTGEELLQLLSWDSDRLGHVIHVHDDFKKEIVRKNIGVELCLSCNIHAKMITGTYSNHHFGWWKDNHSAVALCTDDVGVFGSPLSQEYYLAAKHFSLTKEDVRRLCEGTVDMIFAGPEEKNRLKEIYSSWEGWETKPNNES